MAKVLQVSVAFLFCAVVVPDVHASPPRNVTPTLLSRGEYPEFHVKSKVAEEFVVNPLEGQIVELPVPLDFKAKAGPVGIVVRRHQYGAARDNLDGKNSHTGWHTHPGPVFITVTEGELLIFEWDDLDCSEGIVVRKGEGYVDTGHGHIAINAHYDTPAEDYTVIIAPAKLNTFRGEIPFRDGPGEEAEQRPGCKAYMDDYRLPDVPQQ